jgi:AcrR family transcriptional regulator
MAVSSPTPEAPGRRYRGLSPDERRADQRRRLVRAAIDEFAVRGFHRTSVEDIVRRARTSRTAFYAFFDNREDAMYGALQMSMRSLLDHVREAIEHSPGPDVVETSIRAYVDYLVSDPAAASIVLLEGIATSPEVNALRTRTGRELAELLRAVWAEHDPVAANSPHAGAISVGVLGIITESMRFLIESGRLDQAPEHVPALVSAVERVFAPQAREISHG